MAQLDDLRFKGIRCFRRGGLRTSRVFLKPIGLSDLIAILPRIQPTFGTAHLPACLGRCVTSPRSVWRLPVALGPRVSNDLLSVRVQPPVTRCSLRLATTTGRRVGGAPISPTASLKGPEV